MNRRELLRVALFSHVPVIGFAILWLWKSAAASISCVLGGLCITVPGSVLALTLLLTQLAGRPNPWVVFVGEFLKIIVACILFAVVAKLYADLFWPAMICGIIVGAGSNFILLFIRS